MKFDPDDKITKVLLLFMAMLAIWIIYEELIR